MTSLLSLDLRPKTFQDMVGQSKLTNAIIEHYASGREPRAWMFVGGTGTGKTTLARILALSLNCTHQEKFGSPCKSCQEKFSDFSVIEVNASEAGGVDDISGIAETSNYHPYPPSRRRVYILDEAQRISPPAQNLLLKYFEDAPETTTWIICTTNPEKILPTLQSRCLCYSLVRLSKKGVEKLLLRAKKKTQSKMDYGLLLDELYQRDIQSPRRVLMAYEKLLAGVSVELAVTGVESRIDSLQICKAVVEGDWPSIAWMLKEINTDDARYIRLSVGGYLKGMLDKEGMNASKAVDGIEILSEAVRTEEGLHVATTLAALYRITKEFQR